MTVQLEKLVATLELDSKGFKAGLAVAAAGIGALVAGIGIAAKATFDWANDLDSLGDVMDGTNKDFAALAFVARKSGVGVDALAKSTTFLNKGLLKSNGQLDVVGKKLKEYGIEVKDANGNVKDSVMLTDEIGKKYAELSTQQERLNFLTDIYGKSGANLVDFFDTLAAEGGIDAVTKKVEAFGLAIDPARYEQFQRNLEEIKLIGTGLAVQFVEKIMPAVERFTDWLMKEGIPNTLEFKKKLESAFKVGGIGKALSVLDEEIAKGLDNLDWEGYGDKFGDLLEKALTNSSGEVDVPKSLESLGRGIRDFFISAAGKENVDAFKMLFENLDVFVKFQMEQVNKDLVGKAKDGMARFWAENNDGLNRIKTLFTAWRAFNLGTMAIWGVGLNGVVAIAMSAIKEKIDSKLSQISENWQKRAGAWMRKAADSLSSQKNALLNVVQGIVDEINAILKAIRTSFTISFNAVFGGSSTTGTSSNVGGGLGGGATGGGHNPPKKPKRATGGAVLANQAYEVLELGKPELFTPETSGRIDPLKKKTTGSSSFRMDRRDMRDLAWMLSQENAKAS